VSAPTTHVGFVRAVMIGREGLHRQVLLDIVERAGGADARSYISTGNVSFDADPDEIDTIVTTIEDEIAAVVDRPTPVFVRRLADLRALVRGDPFADAPISEPSHRLVTFVRGRVPDSIQLPIVSGRGYFHVFGQRDGAIFSVTREVDGRTRDPGGIIEGRVGRPVTTRAWGTITRIVDKLA
jgi:uncharacterized protein (DUF1697 family)